MPHCRRRCCCCAGCRGLAGPDSSGSEEDSEEEGSEEDEDAVALGSGSEGEGSGSQGDDDDHVFRQRRPIPRRRGEQEEGEEPLNDADLAEWGVGALAANPEEPVRRGGGGWALVAAPSVAEGLRGNALPLLQWRSQTHPRSPSIPAPTVQIPLLPDATRRLAVVDLDWEHVRAVDILVALRSFLPKGGAIQRVVVYPSGALRGAGGGALRSAARGWAGRQRC